MAIAPTGAIYKSLVFDGEDSRNYGVYITGQAVYNAPGRDVEMVEIPGRNGSFALDKGRFQNIEVSYPAGIFADTETDFAEAISDFRNFLCSRRGYVRLTDEYNPNEYRMAIYKSGLEVTPAQLKAGEFEIVFDCKPQRWLTSGETAVTVSSGGTINNPTLFEASPLLTVDGYGTIGINGETVTIDNVPLGKIQISSPTNASVTLDTANVNTGDRIYKTTPKLPEIHITFTCRRGSFNMVRNGDVANANVSLKKEDVDTYTLTVWPIMDSFYKGTNATITASIPLQITYSGGSYLSAVMNVSLKYTASTETVNFTTTAQNFPSTTDVSRQYGSRYPRFYADSTKTALPQPLYIDLDIGEAYGVLSGEPLSFNNLVTMPTDLPKLKTGTNTFTKTSSITSLKVTPRWWKV